MSKRQQSCLYVFTPKWCEMCGTFEHEYVRAGYAIARAPTGGTPGYFDYRCELCMRKYSGLEPVLRIVLLRA